MLPLIWATLLFSTANAASLLNIDHVLAPSSVSSADRLPWTLRGSVGTVSAWLQLEATDSFALEVANLKSQRKLLENNFSKLNFYEGSASENYFYFVRFTLGSQSWIKSVPACLLETARADNITVTSSGKDREIMSINYLLNDPRPCDALSVSPQQFSKNIGIVETSIQLQTPVEASTPKLTFQSTHSSTGSSPDGTPSNEPEKTFLQKYWMYIVMFLVMTLIKSPKEPEQENKQGQPANAARVAGGATANRTNPGTESSKGKTRK